MDNQLAIRFSGDGNIKIETLTEFLDRYKEILYLINHELGYKPEDMILEVSPPENGSFKIKLKSKYKNLILEKFGDLTAATLAGLLLLFVTNISQQNTEEEIKKILKDKQIVDKDVTKNVYNIYLNTTAKQKIHQTFVIVNNDENIRGLQIEKLNQEIININRTDFPKLIDQISEIESEELPETDILKDEASLIIKTIHFEGNAKWAFVFRGYNIKAYIKDEIFLKKLNTESFRKGDVLRVILSRKRNFDKDLETYIVDQNSYLIEHVIEHKSKGSNQRKLNFE